MPAISKTVQHADADIFTALAHPVRRQILDRLIAGEESVTQLAEPFDLTRPAISQHLRILKDVGLVTEQRHGREHYYCLQPQRLFEIRDWLQKYDHFWRNHLADLGTYLERTNE
ncbi:MAG TPA: metalloregulator ArsR/SmtB family transcription factor [Ktedonobacteraceae bacterium]|jgi:DNA-binding transcriptional ArsR family regulator